MTRHSLTNAAGWTDRLATLLETAQEGDVITVPNLNIVELAENAAKRMNKWPSVRIMTEETWKEIDW